MPLPFHRHILSNGLRLIVHEDQSTPLASCNVVYKVGSRDENPERTGMAHLFEHFMFTGSKNIADYDAQLQSVGAINNAYTTQDITHYYITLPAVNIEHALWLESDRMMELAFQQEKLDIQKHVVIEEFKENFLNRPYGDLWMLYNQFYYQHHPYQWLPIGKEISHIEKVSMENMKDFFFRFYRPNNAVLTISGNVKFEEIVPMVEKWFGDIPSGPEINRQFPQEEKQTKHRIFEVQRNVPADMLFKGWPTCGRLEPDFYAYDMLSDLFGSGQSSYLYQKFVMEEAIFSDISAYISGHGIQFTVRLCPHSFKMEIERRHGEDEQPACRFHFYQQEVRQHQRPSPRYQAGLVDARASGAQAQGDGLARGGIALHVAYVVYVEHRHAQAAY